jgi:hypothetical protein
MGKLTLQTTSVLAFSAPRGETLTSTSVVVSCTAPLIDVRSPDIPRTEEIVLVIGIRRRSGVEHSPRYQRVLVRTLGGCSAAKRILR